MARKKKEEKKQETLYNIQLTENQLRILSYVCDTHSRLICGQDMDLCNLMESAWEKHCKKATGNSMDKEWDGGWYKAREDAQRYSKEIRQRFWFCGPATFYGLHYDDTADMLFDMHQVFRHQLWLDMPEEERETMKWTVIADTPMQFSKEPLVKVNKVETENNEKK